MDTHRDWFQRAYVLITARENLKQSHWLITQSVVRELTNQNDHFVYSMTFVTSTTSETLLKFFLYDFNDYDNELAHLQIPTLSLNKALLLITVAQERCEQLFHWRLLAGKLFIEITWSETTINASRAMLNNCTFI